MFWRNNSTNICEHWDCYKEAQDGGSLCSEHQAELGKGIIDKCPRCGRYKDASYEFCLDCYVGRKVKKKTPPPGYSPPSNEERLQQTGVLAMELSASINYYVYIVEVGDGILFTGRTEDIHERMTEVRKSRKSPVTGHPLKLFYLEKVKGTKTSKNRVTELKELVKSSPEHIQFLSVRFYRNMAEFGFDT